MPTEENETTELWREYRRAQQQRRADRLPIRSAEIEDLSRPGYKVRKLTDYQFRVNGVLDLFPIHRRYHNIKTGRRGGYRGGYKNLLALCFENLNGESDART